MYFALATETRNVIVADRSRACIHRVPESVESDAPRPNVDRPLLLHALPPRHWQSGKRLHGNCHHNSRPVKSTNNFTLFFVRFCNWQMQNLLRNDALYNIIGSKSDARIIHIAEYSVLLVL